MWQYFLENCVSLTTIFSKEVAFFNKLPNFSIPESEILQLSVKNTAEVSRCTCSSWSSYFVSKWDSSSSPFSSLLEDNYEDETNEIISTKLLPFQNWNEEVLKMWVFSRLYSGSGFLHFQFENTYQQIQFLSVFIDDTFQNWYWGCVRRWDFEALYKDSEVRGGLGYLSY